MWQVRHKFICELMAPEVGHLGREKLHAGRHLAQAHPAFVLLCIIPLYISEDIVFAHVTKPAALVQLQHMLTQAMQAAVFYGV